MHVSGSHTRRRGVGRSFRNANQPTIVGRLINIYGHGGNKRVFERDVPDFGE
jgi:hypothetical protein